MSLCPERVLMGPSPFGRCFTISKRVSFRYKVPFKLLLLHWFLRGVSLYMSPLREVSHFPTALWVSRHEPCYISKPDILGAYLFIAHPGVGIDTMEHEPFIAQRKALDFWDPSQLWITSLQVGFLMRLPLCPSYSSTCGLYTVCCRGTVQLVLGLFQREFLHM